MRSFSKEPIAFIVTLFYRSHPTMCDLSRRAAAAVGAAAKIVLVLRVVTISAMFCGNKCVNAFVVPAAHQICAHQRHAFKHAQHTTNSRLFGLSEWRQGFAADDPHNAPLQPQPLLLLPFATSDILPIGQSTTIVLKEGRYYDLFQDCIDDYESIMGMVIMGDDGLCDTLVLCNISDFDVDAGYRGKVTVSVTLRAVGRAALVELVQMKPIMMGMCLEMMDEAQGAGAGGSTDTDDEWTLAQELLGDIESILPTLGLEYQYNDALDLAQRALIEDGTIEDDVEETENQSRLQMTAASWAVLGACMPNNSSDMISSCLQEAMATTSPLIRLKLGRKALLEMMYQGNDMTDASATEASGDMMGFG